MPRLATTLVALPVALLFAATQAPAASDADVPPIERGERITNLKPPVGDERTLDDFLRDPAIVEELAEASSAAAADEIEGTFVFCIDVPTARRVEETTYIDTWKMALEYNPETGCNELKRQLDREPRRTYKIQIEQVKRRFRIPMTAKVAQLLAAELCGGEDACCDTAAAEPAADEADPETDSIDTPQDDKDEPSQTPDRTERPKLEADARLIRPASMEWRPYDPSRFAEPQRRIAAQR